MSIKNLFSRKRIIWTTLVVVILVFIGVQIFGGDKPLEGVTTENARVQDLKSTVLATGQVVSGTDLDLSFKGSGIVRRVNVKVGDKVTADQLLANLDQRDQQAALTSARASVASAQANYNKIVEGSSSEEVAVAQVALDNAKKQQDLAVETAYRALLNSTPEATANINNLSDYAPTVTGTYSDTKEGTYIIKQHGRNFEVSGLEKQGVTRFDSNVPIATGSKGLFLTFSLEYTLAAQSETGDEWTIELPNKKAVNYVTNYNAYQTALRTRDTTIAAAQANLDLAKARARPADLEAARAQILAAQGQLQAAQAGVESTEIRAPADGTITKIDIKVGEVATSLTPVVVLQDVGNLYLEADISEANIANVKAGQTVEVTFDALGIDRKFTAKVANIDPASTVVAGVVNYKVTALLDAVEDIKPGMTANMTILTGEKPKALAVPSRAVISRDGKKYVRVVTNPKTKAHEEAQVTTGFEADSGLIEITSGLSEGQEVVTFIESK